MFRIYGLDHSVSTPRLSYILEVTRQRTTLIVAINNKLQDSCNNPSSMGRMPEFCEINP